MIQSRLLARSAACKDSPVTLPPGRARLVTSGGAAFRTENCDLSAGRHRPKRRRAPEDVLYPIGWRQRLRVGQISSWCSIRTDEGLSLDGLRAGRMRPTVREGQEPMIASFIHNDANDSGN